MTFGNNGNKSHPRSFFLKKFVCSCLNQQQTIENMEKEAQKMKDLMISNNYVLGGALSTREPSFCPEVSPPTHTWV